MAIQLSLADVKDEGLKAYNEKRLSAQGPTPSCQYRDPSGRPCIVGAAMSDKEVAEMVKTAKAYNVFTVDQLRGENLLVVDPTEFEAIQIGQQLHDGWASAMEDKDKVAIAYVGGHHHRHTADEWEALTVQWLNT